MPNRPVRDQWGFLRKMERHFPIKPGQPIEMALVILNSFTELLPKNYLIRAKNPFVKNMWTTSRGDPEYSGQKKPKRTFPFEFQPAKFAESLA